MERSYGVDREVALRHAECEGGSALETESGTVVPMRLLYRGRLTGVYFEEGDPPWRWYEMFELSLKPAWHADDSVWCEAGFIFFLDEAPALSEDAP
jgi:hypothetical protein